MVRFFGAFKANFVSFILFFFALGFGLLARLIGVFNYTNFLRDQGRDQIAIAGIARGILPHLGPESSIGLYSIPPLYFYLASVFTFFDPNNPNLAIISNALFSFLSIFLGAFLVFEFLKDFSFKIRFFCSSIFASIWSVFYVDLLLNAKEWNPSSLNFFLFLFILIFYWIFIKDYSNYKKAFLWILQGINLGVLVSLHSSALFIFPPIFFLISLIFVYQNRTKFYFPIIGLLSFIVALTPYWIGEYANKFANSRLLLKTILIKNSESPDLFHRLEKVPQIIAEFSTKAYFVDLQAPNLFLFLFSVCFCIVIINYNRFQKVLTDIYFLIILVFFVVISSYVGEIFAHYAIIMWSFGIIIPILALALSLELLESKRVSRIISSLSFIIFLFVIFVSNLNYSTKFILTKIGRSRLANTNDYSIVITKILDNLTLCSTPDQKYAFDYFAKIQNKKINLEEIGGNNKCDFEYFNKFKLENMNAVPNLINNNGSVFFEDEVSIIYKTN